MKTTDVLQAVISDTMKTPPDVDNPKNIRKPQSRQTRMATRSIQFKLDVPKEFETINNGQERLSTFICCLSLHSQFVQETLENAKFASTSCPSVDNAETRTCAGSLA